MFHAISTRLLVLECYLSYLFSGLYIPTQLLIYEYVYDNRIKTLPYA